MPRRQPFNYNGLAATEVLGTQVVEKCSQAGNEGTVITEAEEANEFGMKSKDSKQHQVRQKADGSATLLEERKLRPRKIEGVT